MKRYVTNRPLVIMYRGHAFATADWAGVELHIPAGHPINKSVGGLSHPVVYYADNPGALWDATAGDTLKGTLLHDATYYGIPIPEDAVKEV